MIGIAGGGISGLALGHYLRAAGVPHVVFEATDRPGGVMHARRVDGKLLEWGPQRGRMTAQMAELVDELGIRDRVVTAPPGLPLYVLRGGRLRKVPFSIEEFLTSDILSWAAKARLLFEPLSPPADDKESVADFFTRKIGREAYENLVGPLYGGLYASDPANMVVGLSLRHVLREFDIGRSFLVPLLKRGGRIDPPSAFTFDDGLETLTNAMYERNRENVRLAAPVQAIRREGAGFRIEAAGESVSVDDVVLTTPAGAAAKLLAPMSATAAERLAALRYNPLAVVHLYAETSLRGLGYQVSLAENTATRGVTWNDSMFGRDGVYTVYLGGARMPHVVDLPDERLGGIAAEEFERATGYPARALSVAREQMPAWDRSWAALKGITMPEGVHLCANWWTRPGIPGRLHEAKRLAETLSASRTASAAA